MTVRSPLHTPRAALVAVVAASLALAACGGSSSTSAPPGGSGSTAAAPTTLHIAFGADMQVPDPDIFYELEGNAVDDLGVRGSHPVQAGRQHSSRARSRRSGRSLPTAKTYTFTLRPGVKFHDGTAMDSTAVEKSFQRRTAVNSSPAYMLSDVASYETPNPTTFVVKLKNPVSPFLDYLASPYGPKVDSPARDSRARRHRPRAVVAQVARCRHRPVHDLLVRARPEVRAHGLQRVLGPEAVRPGDRHLDPAQHLDAGARPLERSARHDPSRLADARRGVA